MGFWKWLKREAAPFLKQQAIDAIEEYPLEARARQIAVANNWPEYMAIPLALQIRRELVERVRKL